jgi:ketosteroid isomerase-like protein
MTHLNHLEQLVQHFEALSPETVGRLSELYAKDAFFKDPFNEVRGQRAITCIFDQMFKHVVDPRFVVTCKIVQGEDAFIIWDFLFRLKKGNHVEQCIHGSSHLRFEPDGRVNYHRDYWDAAEELYEKIPLLGSLMRFLKRRVQS